MPEIKRAAQPTLFPLVVPTADRVIPLPLLSLEQACDLAHNPPPISYHGPLQDKAQFAENVWTDNSETTLEPTTIYLKLPHTPIVLHPGLAQFEEFVALAARMHYQNQAYDPQGDFMTLTLTQKSLTPGDASTFLGRHFDLNYEEVLSDRAALRDVFLASNSGSTLFYDVGVELAPVLRYLIDNCPPEEIFNKIGANSWGAGA
jgi:hypothetical protein